MSRIKNIKEAIRNEKIMRGGAPSFDVFKAGDGATFHNHSDSHACTVVSVSSDGLRMTLQRDKATRKADSKPEFAVGGFAGHCTNAHEIEYDYEPDEEGTLYRLSLRKMPGLYAYCWTPSAADPSGHQRATKGRREFYDYNF